MAQEMNHPSVNIIEQSQVAPPQGSFPSTTLPLSFLDIPFFLTRHVRRIFFYEFPFPTHHFLQTALPNLKTLSFPHPTSNTSSLSPPISSSLHIPTSLTSVTLTATLSHSLLQSLLTQTSPSSPQDVNDWQPLVPVLPSPRTTHDGTSITNSGFSIDNHVAGDGRTIHHFMKFWVSVCKAEGGFSGSVPLPFHDRDIVKDPKGLMRIYLQEIRNSALQSKQFGGFLPSVYTDKVRATFIFSSEQAEKLKKWVSLKCNGHGSGMLHISTFVGTCSLIWVCMIKSEHKEKDLLRLTSDEPCNFGFSAVCHNHPQLLLPSNYFGNCLVPLITAVKRGELEGQNGIVAAANAIGRVIRGFKSDALRGAETMMSDYRGLVKSGQSLIITVGSPKLTAYKTDFGWGKPRKTEVVNLDSVRTISLADCRDKEGGIQVGIALERIRMNNFTNILEEHLRNIAVLD